MHPDYLLDVAYTDQFYEILNPWLINYVSAINGFPPQKLDDGFTYCELGCGNGLSLNVLAAANPGASFHGVDFNPEHIAQARLAMTQGLLSNLTLVETNFSDLDAYDWPDFNFITMHGVFSWISPERRRQITDFISRRLKPGGMAMISYNTPQGWAVIGPLRDFLRSHVADGQGDLLEKARRGLEELRFLRDAGAMFFQMNPLAGIMLDAYFNLDPRYIVHEFLVPHWYPLYFSEVRDHMNQAGLEYAGSLPVALNYGQVCLPAAMHDYFQGLTNRMDFEIRKDFVRMTLLRTDIYHRGPRNPKMTYLDKFRNQVFGSPIRARDFRFRVEMPGCSTFELDTPIFKTLAELIGGHSQNLETILASPHLAAWSPEDIVSALEWLVATDQVKPYARAGLDPAPADSDVVNLSTFNRALALRELPNRKNVALASWTAGSGIALNPKDSLAMLALSEAGVQGAESWAGTWIARNNFPGDQDSPPLTRIIQNVVDDSAFRQSLGFDEPPTSIRKVVNHA